MSALHERMEDLNKKTGAEVLAAIKAGKKASVMRMLFLPPVVFILEYFIKAGFLKGFDGLVQSVFAAQSIFVREVKLWEKHNP